MTNRRLTAFITTLLLALIGAFGTSPALAADPTEHGGKPGDNLALAINETDGSTVVDVAFSIRKVMGDVVDNQNVAVAYASCKSCTTIAIAFQILIVVGDPSVVSPVNVAVAANAGCDFCQTLASAYQFIFGADAGFSFTKRGLREIRRIQREVNRLANSGKPITEIQAGIDALAKRLQGVLERELANYRKHRRDEDQGDNGDHQDGSAPPGDIGDEPPPDEPAQSPAATDPGTSGPSGATGPTDTGTSTTPSDTGTSTTPSDTTPTDTGTTPTPSG